MTKQSNNGEAGRILDQLLATTVTHEALGLVFELTPPTINARREIVKTYRSNYKADLTDVYVYQALSYDCLAACCKVAGRNLKADQWAALSQQMIEGEGQSFSELDYKAMTICGFNAEVTVAHGLDTVVKGGVQATQDAMAAQVEEAAETVGEDPSSSPTS